ncbi:hypothetical protein JW905_03270, partial [bacterium]|nr:hypothetical protein [candidate division CSSED10-310 bacterium]
MSEKKLVLCVLLFVFVSNASAFEYDHSFWFHGSAALNDDAAAMIVNPAGMSMLRSVNYLVQVNMDKDDEVSYAGLLYSFKHLGIGYDYQAGLTDQDRELQSLTISSSHAVLGGRLGFGTNLRAYVPKNDASREWDLDYGIMYRPCSHFSFGLVARNLLEAEVWDYTIPRTYTAAVGIRPFSDRISVGFDVTYMDEKDRDSDDRWRYQGIVDAELMPGINLKLFADDDERYGIGLGLNLPNAGFTMGGVRDGDGDVMDRFCAIAVGVDRNRTMLQNRRQVAEVTVEGVVRDQGRNNKSLFRLLEQFRTIEESAHIEGVLVNVKQLGPGIFSAVSPGAQELHAAIKRVRAAGKHVV